MTSRPAGQDSADLLSDLLARLAMRLFQRLHPHLPVEAARGHHGVNHLIATLALTTGLDRLQDELSRAAPDARLSLQVQVDAQDEPAELLLCAEQSGRTVRISVLGGVLAALMAEPQGQGLRPHAEALFRDVNVQAGALFLSLDPQSRVYRALLTDVHRQVTDLLGGPGDALVLRAHLAAAELSRPGPPRADLEAGG